MENKARCQVKFTFTNKKGEKKTVNVFVDKETYVILPKLSKDDRTKYLEDLYHEQEREKYYSRKTIPFSRFANNEEWDFEPEYPMDVEKSFLHRKLVKEILNHLSKIDKEYILLRFFDNLTIDAIAEKMKVNERTVRRNLIRIIEDLKKHLNIYIWLKCPVLAFCPPI